MNDRIREAFDQVHAEENLKVGARAFLTRKTRGYRRSGRGYRRLVPVLACFLLLLAGWGGYRLYFTPTSVISIDINPSMELEVNRFDRVIAVRGYNPDGEALASSMNVKYLDYAEAVERVLDDPRVAEYLSGDAILSIVVAGEDERQSEAILSEISARTEKCRNAYCYAADFEVVAEAHAHGLSCGKYRMFLEAQALDPDLSIQDVQGMTMKEIQSRIQALTQEEGVQDPGESSSAEHHGSDKGHGNGHGEQSASRGKPREE